MENNIMSSKKEKILYALFFAGQNFLWGYVSFIANYMTDLGIDATLAAIVILIPKIWDAINDTFFGYVMDKVRIKGQKFMPWIRIGVTAIILASIFMFNVPKTLNITGKCIWIVVGYVLFDACYTMLDAPAFAMPNYMTTSIQERTSIISAGKLGGVVAAIIASTVVSFIRGALGWGGAVIVYSIIGVGLMYPFALIGKERVKPVQDEKNETITFKQMGKYLKTNKYLLVVLIALFVCGFACVEAAMGQYIATHCYEDPNYQAVIAGICAVPVILISALIPTVAKKIDKFYILIFGLAFGLVFNVAAYFIGYENKVLSIICVGLKCCGMAFFQIILYMLIADTVEFGAYKSGTHADGITFSLQTFVSKLKGALMTSFILFALGQIKFVSGTDPVTNKPFVQTVEVVKGLWGIFNIIPAAGYFISLVLLILFYKLRDKDVQKMAKYNCGELKYSDISDTIKKFGEPGVINK